MKVYVCQTTGEACTFCTSGVCHSRATYETSMEPKHNPWHRPESKAVNACQYTAPILKRAAVEASLRHDETIICTNATVIVDGEGNVSGWFDNAAPVMVIGKEEE